MRAAPRIAILIQLAACGGGGGTADDTPDAREPDSDPTCGEWTVVTAPSTDLHRFEPAPIVVGRTSRLAFSTMLTGCDVLGMPGVVVTPGETSATIEPFVLRQLGGTCTGAPRTVTRVVELYPALAGEWTVTLDGANSITFTVDPEPATACDPTRTPCATDCDCDSAAGERCLGITASGPTTVCARPCEVDRDCGGAGRCATDGSSGIAFTCTDDPECDATHACPDGFACTAGACAPTFVLGQTTRHECACDADCDPGLRCVRPYDGSQPNRCQAMCETAGPWCEGPHVCGGVESDISGLAGTDAVCGWIGD